MVVSSDHQQQQPTAFPRGKRKKSTSSSSVNNNNDSNKKRATTSSSSSSTTYNDKEPSDFIFGNANETALSHAISAKKKKLYLNNKHLQSDGYHDLEEDDDYHHPTSSSTLPLGGGAVLPPSTTSTGKYIPPKIEPLSFSKFHVGTKVLGIVRNVTDEYAVISLCTMLTGFVKRDSSHTTNTGGSGVSSVSVPLTSVLSVGSIMTFYVLSTEEEVDNSSSTKQRQQQGGGTSVVKKKKRKIELSMWPIHVNSGLRLDTYLLPSTSSSSSSSDVANKVGDTSLPMVVRGRIISIEDHGCLVDLGGILNTIPSSSSSGGGGGSGGGVKQAFLKFDNVEGEYEIVDNDNDDDDSSDDEEESEDEIKNKMDTASIDDKTTSNSNSSSSYKHRLNPHRVYDFTILPSNIITPSSSSSVALLPSIIQLGLPTPTTLSTYYTTSSMIPTLSTLQPGQLLKDVRVEAFAKNGLCVTFNNGVYRGCLDEDHLGGHRGVIDDVMVEGKAGEGGSSVMMKSKGKKGGEGDVALWWRRVFKGKFAKVSQLWPKCRI